MEQEVMPRPNPARPALLALLAVFAIGGCGDSAPASNVPGLPRQEFSLQDLCPERSDIHGQKARDLKRTRQAELEALLKAYRQNPDAEVRVEFTPADEPDVKHETLTVRELMKQNLESLRDAHCSPEAQRRLQQALDEG
jgi:hypothetical protein